MLTEEVQFRTFRDVMAKVGEFLFHWSALEQQLTSSIREVSNRIGPGPTPVRGGLSERLDRWLELVSSLPECRDQLHVARDVRGQALDLRDVRNLIVHGLQAASARLPDRAAHIRCAKGGYEDPDSDTICFTLDDLDRFSQGIDACRRAFIDLSNFNFRTMGLAPPTPRPALLGGAADVAS